MPGHFPEVERWVCEAWKKNDLAQAAQCLNGYLRAAELYCTMWSFINSVTRYKERMSGANRVRNRMFFWQKYTGKLKNLASSVRKRPCNCTTSTEESSVTKAGCKSRFKNGNVCVTACNKMWPFKKTVARNMTFLPRFTPPPPSAHHTRSYR